jgi:glycosyltransferase involved in cell wall biosynthesis
VIRFAVVIPLFNKRPHIERALRSALAQTTSPSEIIVVDDGSTDGSYEYVRGFEQRGIKLFRRERPGPGGYAARNFGIERATADWIAFLDADDEWLPGHLEEIEKTLAASERPQDVVCIGTGYRNLYPGGREENGIYSRAHPGAAPEFLDFKRLLSTWLAVGGAPMWTSATACRRDALIAAGLFPEGRCSRGGDKDMWLRTAALGVTALNPKITANYYKDSVNMVTGKASANDRHCMCQSIEAMLPRTSAAVGLLLRKVYNLEIYKYAVRTLKSSRLDKATWTGFFASANPLQYLVLAAVSLDVVDRILRPVLQFHPRLRRQRRLASAAAPPGTVPE